MWTALQQLDGTPETPTDSTQETRRFSIRQFTVASLLRVVEEITDGETLEKLASVRMPRRDLNHEGKILLYGPETHKVGVLQGYSTTELANFG